MLKRTLLCILLAGSCGLMAAAQAQQFIYKWTDEQGQPKYSELPPPAGIPYETVRKPGGAGSGRAQPRIWPRSRKNWPANSLRKRPKPRSSRNRRKRKPQMPGRKNCEIARKNVEVLQGDRPVVRTDDKGNKVALDAAQREAELQKAKKDQDYFCNP